VGEKGLAEITVFNGVLYATTYTPPSGGVVVPGVCPPPAEGTARLYGLNYLTGAGYADLDGDGDVDRFIGIGGGIPSGLVIVIREGGASGIVGTSGGAKNPGIKSPLPRRPTFWYDE